MITKLEKIFKKKTLLFTEIYLPFLLLLLPHLQKKMAKRLREKNKKKKPFLKIIREKKNIQERRKMSILSIFKCGFH